MNFSISLEDERRESIEVLPSQLALAPAIDLSSFRLLRYLDPYGDTIFNRNQLADLLADLEELEEIAASALISQIISLAARCKNELHTYLCFNGE